MFNMETQPLLSLLKQLKATAPKNNNLDNFRYDFIQALVIREDLTSARSLINDLFFVISEVSSIAEKYDLLEQSEKHELSSKYKISKPLKISEV